MASFAIESIDSIEHSIDILLNYLHDPQSGQILRKWFNYQGIDCLDDFYIYWNEHFFEHARNAAYQISPQLQLGPGEIQAVLKLWKYMNYVVL
jgi:hypothetical protein